MTDDDEVLAAAVLHDVLKDTPTAAADLSDRFGQRVTALVEADSETSVKTDRLLRRGK